MTDRQVAGFLVLCSIIAICVAFGGFFGWPWGVLAFGLSCLCVAFSGGLDL